MALQAHHICIQTDTYKASKDFYMKALGFEMVIETPEFHDRDYNTWLKLGDFMIELMTNKKRETLVKYNKKSRGLAHFCLYTDDFDGAYQKILNLGYTNFNKKNGSNIYSVLGGRLFKVVAPEGTIIEIRDNPDL